MSSVFYRLLSTIKLMGFDKERTLYYKIYLSVLIYCPQEHKPINNHKNLVEKRFKTIKKPNLSFRFEL